MRLAWCWRQEVYASGRQLRRKQARSAKPFGAPSLDLPVVVPQGPLLHRAVRLRLSLTGLSSIGIGPRKGAPHSTWHRSFTIADAGSYTVYSLKQYPISIHLMRQQNNLEHILINSATCILLHRIRSRNIPSHVGPVSRNASTSHDRPCHQPQHHGEHDRGCAECHQTARL